MLVWDYVYKVRVQKAALSSLSTLQNKNRINIGAKINNGRVVFHILINNERLVLHVLIYIRANVSVRLFL